jgi:hypothetical protein
MSRRYFQVLRFPDHDETWQEALSWGLFHSSVKEAERIENFSHTSKALAYRIASIGTDDKPRTETAWRKVPRKPVPVDPVDDRAVARRKFKSHMNRRLSAVFMASVCGKGLQIEFPKTQRGKPHAQTVIAMLANMLLAMAEKNPDMKVTYAKDGKTVIRLAYVPREGEVVFFDSWM